MNLFKNLILNLLFFVPFSISLKAHPSLIVALKDKIGKVLFLDAETFQERKRISVSPYPHEVATHETGEYAVVTHYGNPPLGQEENTISIINVKKGDVTQTIKLPRGSKPHGVVFRTKHRVLVTVENNRKITLEQMISGQLTPLEIENSYLLELNIKTGDFKSLCPLPGKAPHMIVKHPEENEKFVFITDNKTGLVTKVNYSAKKKNNRIEAQTYAGKAAEGIAISEDGDKIYVANRFEKKVYVFKTSNLELINTIKTNGGAIRLALYGLNQEYLVTSSLFNPLGSRLNTYNLEDGTRMGGVESVGGFWPKWNPIPLPLTLLVYPENLIPAYEQKNNQKKISEIGKKKNGKLIDKQNRVLVSNSWAQQIGFVNMDTRKIESYIHTGGHPDGMAFSPFSPDPERELNTNEEPLHRGLHELELEFQDKRHGDHVMTADNFRLDRTISAYSVIDATIQEVCNVLTNFQDYSWNEFLRNFQLEKKENDKICWEDKTFLGKSLVVKRCLYVRVLQNGKTLYYTIDHFKNFLSTLAYKTMKEKIQTNLQREADSLKHFCEKTKDTPLLSDSH